MNTETIFRGYDQAALDAQYNNRGNVPNFAEYYEAWEPQCAEVLAEFDHHMDLKYGKSPREAIDLVLPPGPGPHPVQLYIHGGYWMMRDKSDQTFLARPFVEAGAAFGLIEYDLIPNVRMADIVRQCRGAVAWIHAHAGTYNIDRDRICISGHSAGGHLTAMLAATDWTAFSGGPADMIKGGCAISGIYELQPIQLSFMQETLNFTDQDLEENSPIRFADVPATPLVVAAGGDESDEFHRQSKALTEDWNVKGGNCTYMERPGCNHFSILSDLSTPDSDMVKGMLAQMGL